MNGMCVCRMPVVARANETLLEICRKGNGGSGAYGPIRLPRSFCGVKRDFLVKRIIQISVIQAA